MSGTVRWGIALRLGLLLAVVGVLAAGATGFYAYRASRGLLVDAAKHDLLVATRVMARRVTLKREEISRDLLLLASHPAALAALRQGEAAQVAQLDTLFRLVMQASPGYFQIRLISAADHGMERVRVDRDTLGLVSVTGEDLQEKGHYLYVLDTLKLPAGQTYLSRIVINHERGAHAGVDQPSVALAMPVTDSRGVALGVVVINADLKDFFSQMVADLPREYQLFLANQQGDFLIHPDPSQTFGFDRGRRVLVQDEFAATADLVSGKTDHVLVEADRGRYAQAPVMAAFIGNKIKVATAEAGIIVGVAQPLASVVEQANQLGGVILKIVLGLCLGCVLLALVLARFIARPINSMSMALARFGQDHQKVHLPTQRGDEIGVLARSFDQMQQQISRQLAELKDSRQELEHLARHDMLTGLPNRRFFQDRLDHAVARARRSGKRMAVLFIDLDNFKDINDSYGHDAGDAVLKAVAERLAANTRASDTVARLGGDEFVVLLDEPAHQDQIAAMVQKLLDSLKSGIPFGMHILRVGASIGISQYPQNGVSANDILANADRAMYRVKALGRNGYQFFS